MVVLIQNISCASCLANAEHAMLLSKATTAMDINSRTYNDDVEMEFPGAHTTYVVLIQVPNHGMRNARTNNTCAIPCPTVSGGV